MLAFLFAGQGSQYLGMGQDLYDTYDCVKERFHHASTILGYDVTTVLFQDEEKLNDTLYTQPLMFLLYVSILDVLKQHDITSTHTCGLSLGEYGAYYDAGIITFEEGLKLLQVRGEAMANASKTTKGAMSAILGLDADVLEGILKKAPGYVTIANYNTYGQLVISGEESAVQWVNEEAKNQGAKRAISLNTSGPFHSELMKEAAQEFATYVQNLSLQQPIKNILINTTGTYLEDDVKTVMVEQITNSVLFYQMIEQLLQDGVRTFIEIGPKKTLSSFVKKIDRSVTILQVEDTQTLENTLQALEEEYGI